MIGEWTGRLHVSAAFPGDTVVAVGLAVVGIAQVWASGDLSWKPRPVRCCSGSRLPYGGVCRWWPCGLMAGLGVLVASGADGDVSAAAPIAGLIALYSVGAYAVGWSGVAGAGGVLTLVWIAVGPIAMGGTSETFCSSASGWQGHGEWVWRLVVTAPARGRFELGPRGWNATATRPRGERSSRNASASHANSTTSSRTASALSSCRLEAVGASSTTRPSRPARRSTRSRSQAGRR